MACATVGATSPSRPSLDPSDDDDTMEKTRLVVVEFLGSGGDDDRARLEKVGEWYIDGPAEGVELHLESDSELVTIRLQYLGLHSSRLQLNLVIRYPELHPCVIFRTSQPTTTTSSSSPSLKSPRGTHP